MTTIKVVLEPMLNHQIEEVAIVMNVDKPEAILMLLEWYMKQKGLLDDNQTS